MMEVDKYFNLENSSVDSEHNFEKFYADMVQIFEEERLNATAPKIPKVPEQYGERQCAPKDKQATMVGMIKDIYMRSKIDPKVIHVLDKTVRREMIEVNK